VNTLHKGDTVIIIIIIIIIIKNHIYLSRFSCHALPKDFIGSQECKFRNLMGMKEKTRAMQMAVKYVAA
jgi:hypothetical protein